MIRQNEGLLEHFSNEIIILFQIDEQYKKEYDYDAMVDALNQAYLNFVQSTQLLIENSLAGAKLSPKHALRHNMLLYLYVIHMCENQIVNLP